MSSVHLKKLSRLYGQVKAVDDLYLDIPDHTFVTLLGPSGCGKSTTLNLVAGLDRPTSGEIYLNDRLLNNVPPNERPMAMVFQNYALYPHKTVYGNLSFSLQLKHRPSDEIQRRVNRVAETLDIGHLLNRKPSELSGGQQQRVALGRALIKEPEVFLLDEPLSNLDAALRARMRTEIKRLHLQLRTTTIFVTHDQEEAMSLSDLIAIMNHGKLVQFGTPDEIYRRPASLYVATFIGKPQMSLLQGKLRRDNGVLVFQANDLRLELTPGQASTITRDETREVTAGIRAEDIVVVPNGTADDSNRVNAKVSLLEPVGSDTFVELDSGAGKIVARTSPDLPLRLGDVVDVRLPAAKIHLFDRTTQNRLV